jgi:hypothetical protein
MKYLSARCIQILKPRGKSGVKSLMTHNLRIIERTFLNALEPQFEGIFSWKSITKKEYLKLLKEKFTEVRIACKQDSSKTFYLKITWLLPKVFRDTSFGFRSSKLAHMALYRIKH